MKTKFTLGVLTILAMVAIIGLQFDTTEQKTSQVSQEKMFTEYPGEWFYNQRAYPNNYINKEAIRKAEIQTRDILNNRATAAGIWELEGPINTGGRVTDIAIDPTNDNIIYFAAATGGVFKTTDQGVNWTPIFDTQDKFSIGNLAIAPSNANVIYVGTGEANASATSGAFFGNGVYRSNDGGANWTNIGLEDTEHIARIVVDPNDEDRLFVAATGTLYGTNNDRGIYRTTDGGATWDQVLFVSNGTAAIDLVMNPLNPDILHAAMWERIREPWQRDYAGLTSAIHRSTDGGATWTELGAVNGLPAPNDQTGRIGLAIAESNPDILYARYTTNEITNEFDALYKSTDGGQNWTNLNANALLGVDSSFGWYFGNLRVNPIDPDELFVLGQRLFRSVDGGGNWNENFQMHVDHHAMEYSKNDPNLVFAGNDGGIYRSTDGGNNWGKYLNLPITQFYNIEVDFQQPERLFGGTQDNNTITTFTGSQDDWFSVWGGDGFHVSVEPADNNFIYVESQFGGLGRSTDGGNSFFGATDGIDFADRNNWNTPVVISPFNNQRVYCGTQRLYQSTRSEFWTAMSPDLTDGQHPSGSTSYGTLTAIGPSYLNEDTIYTGSDDGNVHVTFDGGITWTNVSTGLPDRYITAIAISPSDDLTAYVSLSGYRSLDYDPHIFKTTDGGQNWTDVSGNLPGIPVNEIIINSAETMLFAATDVAVWYSENDGATWTVLGDNLPITITRDLKLHEPTNTLYAGTYGRSMYSYDLSQLLNVEDFESTTNLRIYPVPANEQITISHRLATQGTIELYDILGKRVKELHQGSLTETQNRSFQLGDIEAGIYFVRIATAEGQITKKIVVR